MKKRNGIWILLFLILLFLGGLCFADEEQDLSASVKAVNGVLDLTHWDFEKNGVVQLDGYWEFYWMQYFYHKDFFSSSPSSAPLDKKFLWVPGSWNHHQENGKEIGPIGHGTYRLLIRVPSIQHYAIKIYPTAGPYILWIDGEKKASNGTLGTSKETAKPQEIPLLFSFMAKTKTVEVLIQTANYHYYKGGVWGFLYFAPEEQLIRNTNFKTAYIFLVLGSLLIMGIYHLGLFFLRSAEKSPLYFGLFSLSLLIRFLLTGEHSFIISFPNINWELQYTIEFLTLYCCTVLFAWFVQNLYPKEMSRRVIAGISYFSGIYVLLTLFTPAIFYSQFLVYYHIFIVLISSYGVYVLVLARVRHRLGAGNFLFGFFCFFLTVVNDILNTNELLSTGYWTQLGIFIFILAQSFVLSRRFSRAFQKVEEMKVKLQILNEELEDKVHERTADLQKEVKERRRIEWDLKKENKVRESDLRLAEEFQVALLPQIYDLPFLKTRNLYIPYSEVSGDLYDIHVDPEDESISVFLGDATGHGISAAFMTMMMHISLENIKKEVPTDGVMRQLNQLLASIETGKSMTGIYLRISPKGELVATHAGHPPLIILPVNGDDPVLFGEGGCPLGMFIDEPVPYQEEKCQLEIGDQVFIYTDAIIEWSDPEGNQFDISNLLQFLIEERALSLEEKIEKLPKVLEEFGKGNACGDDLTLLAFELTCPDLP